MYKGIFLRIFNVLVPEQGSSDDSSASATEEDLNVNLNVNQAAAINGIYHEDLLSGLTNILISLLCLGNCIKHIIVL